MTDEAVPRESTVVEVTVYRDGARVVRAVKAALSEGLQTVLLLQLPATTDPASVRVASRSSGTAIVEVQAELRHGTESATSGARALEARVLECRSHVQELADADTAESARLQYLAHLSESSASALARALAFGHLERAELQAMEDHLADRTEATLARRRQILERKAVAERELHAAEAALEDLTRGKGTERSPVDSCEARATIEAASELVADLEISYQVRHASWRPLYDIRTEGSTLRLVYLAEVTQRSGEDWPETRLTLSTSRTGAYQVLPELQPWYVELYRALPAAPRAAGLPPLGAFGASAPDELPPSPPPPRAAAAGGPDRTVASPPVLVADVREHGAVMAFGVPRPVAVAADGAPRKVTVAELDLDATLDYLAVPVLAAEAYLRATATNTSSVVLLPGPAQVFHDGEFVGRTELGTIAPGEEFELQLGVDERIRLERTLSRRRASKAMLGGGRKLEVVYEIVVENHRTLPASIDLRDRIPVARDAEVKVRLVEAEPEPAEQDDLGELSWKLVLEPGAARHVRFGFTAEYPSGRALSGV